MTHAREDHRDEHADPRDRVRAAEQDATRVAEAGADAWRKNAARWIAHADRTAELTAPVTRALLDALDLQPGQRVLDVACGAGDPALQLATRVGREGTVTACDAVPAMLDALRGRAEAQGLDNVRTLCAEADALDVRPCAFDAACSRFGVMFFGDAPRALAIMRRAVREDGRLAATAWSVPERTPYFTLAAEALDAAGAPPLELPPGTRTVWEYAEPGLLAATASGAGWRDVQDEAVRFEMAFPGPPDALLDAYESLSEKVSARLSGCDAARRRAARAALADAARPYVRGDLVALPAEALLVTGRA